MGRLLALVVAALCAAGCIPVCDRENVCALEDTRLCDGVTLRPCDGSSLGDLVPCPLGRAARCDVNGWKIVAAHDGGAP